MKKTSQGMKQRTGGRGTADNDILAGGGGKDLLIAGAGDDYILGDSDYFPTWFWADAPSYTDITNSIDWYHSAPNTLDWGVTLQGDTYVFAPVYSLAVKDPADSGNDILYAGAGDDQAWAGSGDDVVYGEDGADELRGEAGNDILIGGAGDDKLFGDGGVGVRVLRFKCEAANDAEGRMVA